MYVLFWDPEGSPLNITVEVLLDVKYMGIKSDDTAFLGEHVNVIISYLL